MSEWWEIPIFEDLGEKEESGKSKQQSKVQGGSQMQGMLWKPQDEVCEKKGVSTGCSSPAQKSKRMKRGYRATDFKN